MTASTTSRFRDTPSGMVVTDVTGKEIEEAKRLRGARERRKGTRHSLTSMIWAGELGEIVFAAYLDDIGASHAIWYRDDDLGHDFVIGSQLAIDVKTQTRKAPNMSPSYGCNVASHKINSKPGEYFFLSYNHELREMCLCGAMPRSQFAMEARFLKAGEHSPISPLVAHHDMYWLPVSRLVKPRDWRETLPDSAQVELSDF